jgi:hypothetical protein
MVENNGNLHENQQMRSTFWSYEHLYVYFEYISNKNGCSGSLYADDPYFKTFYFILKWAEVRKLQGTATMVNSAQQAYLFKCIGWLA